MEHGLRVALEAGDSERLLQLCGELDTNISLTISGYEAGSLEMPLTHHVVCKAPHVQFLKVLIDRLGSACLKCKDKQGNTAVHHAALNQDNSWMQVISETLSSECFKVRGELDRTAFHSAAMNTCSNSAFKWLVTECGSKCLTEPDAQGDTPVHLAAWKQSADSLQFIADQIGTKVYWLKGFNDWTVTHQAAQNTITNSALQWCVRNLGKACLIEQDSQGRTPLHLAAQHQHGDSLQLVTDALDISVFELVDFEGKTLADYAAMNSDSDRMMQCFAELKLKLQPISVQLRCANGQLLQRRRRNLQEMAMNFDLLLQPPTLVTEADQLPETVSPTVDPDFTTWNFILDNGTKRPIGSGGFGEVYKVFTDKHQTVAVKIIKLMGASNAQTLEKAIQNEQTGIDILKHIRHPNILLFLKSEYTTDGQLCIFTELISGHSLFDLMRQTQKPFDEPGVRKFSQQICSALNYLHCKQQRPILHRDIKCSNIMLTHEGVIKLIDFGLAKEISTTTGLSANVRGTWYFMAPELFNGDGRAIYTPKSDVWAFGCTVFEMVTRKPPNAELGLHQIPLRVTGRDMPELPLTTSISLREFYRRCVVKQPGGRADTAELMRHGFLQQ